MNEYENPWRDFEFKEVAGYSQPQLVVPEDCQYVVGFDVKHIETGKIYTNISGSPNHNYVLVKRDVWTNPGLTNYKRLKHLLPEGKNSGFVGKIKLSPKDCKWRFHDKIYQKYKWCKENLKVGDFVKCKGTRSGDWNKVENVSGHNIFGPKYTKPEEGFMRYTSSENGIAKIQEVVRNGIKIL